MIRFRVGHAIRAILASFWFWPLALILFAIGLAQAVPVWTARISSQGIADAQHLVTDAGAYSVAILTTTAAADVTIMTFVFSTLMVVLQLASNQLSPRILRPTIRQGSAQRTMGIMAGGFVFSVWALLDIFDAVDPLAVAAVTLIALGWTLVVVITFLHFVSVTISNIRAPAVIRFIADETAGSIRRTYQFRETGGGQDLPQSEETSEIVSHRDGVITGISTRGLVAWARRHDAVVELDVGLGHYVSRGVPIGHVRTAENLGPSLSPARFLVVERERTLRDDPPYGFRLLVDIANRALSPAVNDPTTAVQVLDELQSLLVLLAERPEMPGRMHDTDGVLRLVLPTMSWRAYLRTAVQEIYEYGRESSQVTQRIARLLDDLAGVVSGDHATAVAELRRIVDVVEPLIRSQPAAETA